MAEVAELLRKEEGNDPPRQQPHQQFSLQESVDSWHATVGSLGAHGEAVTVVCTADRPLTSSMLTKMVSNLPEFSSRLYAHCSLVHWWAEPVRPKRE